MSIADSTCAADEAAEEAHLNDEDEHLRRREDSGAARYHKHGAPQGDLHEAALLCDGVDQARKLVALPALKRSNMHTLEELVDDSPSGEVARVLAWFCAHAQDEKGTPHDQAAWWMPRINSVEALAERLPRLLVLMRTAQADEAREGSPGAALRRALDTPSSQKNYSTKL